MAFKFRFEQLLILAVHEEKEVSRRLAIKDGQIAEIDLRIGKLRQEYDSALDDKVLDLQRGNMERLRMYPAYLQRLQRQQEFEEEERERLVKQREKILEELTSKRQTRMTYEKVKERDAARFRKEQMRLDQKRMDDFAGRRPNADPASGQESGQDLNQAPDHRQEG